MVCIHAITNAVTYHASYLSPRLCWFVLFCLIRACGTVNQAVRSCYCSCIRNKHAINAFIGYLAVCSCVGLYNALTNSCGSCEQVMHVCNAQYIQRSSKYMPCFNRLFVAVLARAETNRLCTVRNRMYGHTYMQLIEHTCPLQGQCMY